MICDKCDKEFDRFVKINEKVIENYNNIYGTRCPYCRHLVKPEQQLKLVQENKIKRDKLRDEFLDKWKK